MSSNRFGKWLFLTFLAVICALSISTLSSWGDEAKDSEWKVPARAARKKNPIPADDKSIAAGKEVYVKQCLSCHGDAGHGNGPAAKDLDPKPKDLASDEVQAHTDGALFWMITTGKKPMPSFENLTTEEERWNVVNYVRTLASKPANPPASQPAQ